MDWNAVTISYCLDIFMMKQKNKPAHTPQIWGGMETIPSGSIPFWTIIQKNGT